MLAATILFIATNAGMIGISRLSWSLAEHRQLPQHLLAAAPDATARRGSRSMFFSVLAGMLILYGNTEVLGNLYSFGAMLSFTTAHAAIIALRVKDPDRERPYRAPWGVRIRGSVIPMTAVIGGIGTAAAWVAVSPAHRGAIVGIPWMVVGMGGYFYYRHRQGLDPRKSYRIAARRAPAGLPGARLPHRARADLRRRRLRRGAVQRRQADRRRRRRLRDLRAARAQPAVAGVGPGGGGGPGTLGAGERAHPGAPRGHQDPHRPDPHPQPRRGAGRRSRAGRLGRDLLVDDPRPRGRAADRADRGLSAQPSGPAA